MAAEIFASTLDIYLVLGDIESEPDNRSTADGRPATAEAARDRLARMVGADRDSFSALDAISFAQAADECLIERSSQAAERACAATIGRPGRRGHLAARGVSWPGGWRTAWSDSGGRSSAWKEAWGEVAAAAGCAFALLDAGRGTLAQRSQCRTRDRKPATRRRITA